MRKFVVTVLAFVFVALFCSVCLDIIITKGLLRTDCYRYQTFSDIFKGNAKYDVLYMGNSRCFSHFNPLVIDSACNVNSYGLGLGGYAINAQISIYHCYKSHNMLPKLIVQQVDFLTFQKSSDIRHQHDSERFFTAVYDKAMRKELVKLGYGWGELYIPLYRYIGYQKVIKDGLLEFLHIKHYVERPAYKGFSPEKGQWDSHEADAMDSIDICFDEYAKKMFEDYLQECKKDNINVVLVNTPVYYKTLAKVKDYNEMTDYFESISKKYGFDYLDYSNGYYICYDSSFFSNTTHLNSAAADIFSTDFAKDLKGYVNNR